VTGLPSLALSKGPMYTPGGNPLPVPPHPNPTHSPHNTVTVRAATARPWTWDLNPLACGFGGGGAAGAVPDLTPTPRGPEAEVGNSSSGSRT